MKTPCFIALLVLTLLGSGRSAFADAAKQAANLLTQRLGAEHEVLDAEMGFVDGDDTEDWVGIVKHGKGPKARVFAVLMLQNRKTEKLEWIVNSKPIRPWVCDVECEARVNRIDGKRGFELQWESVQGRERTIERSQFQKVSGQWAVTRVERLTSSVDGAAINEATYVFGATRLVTASRGPGEAATGIGGEHTRTPVLPLSQFALNLHWRPPVASVRRRCTSGSSAMQLKCLTAQIPAAAAECTAAQQHSLSAASDVQAWQRLTSVLRRAA